jgi:hypothetical protein
MNDVRIFDVTTSPITLKKTLPVDGVPFFAAWSADNSRLYVPVQPNALVVYDVTADFLEVDGRFFTPAECDKPHEAVLGTDGLWLVCEGEYELVDQKSPGTVLHIDPAQGLPILTSTEVGMYPDRIVLLEGRP